MYFCPKCNYSFDITKSTKTIDERKNIDDPREILKRLKAKKNLSNYFATFPKQMLEENKLYKSLSEKEKTLLEVVFNKNISLEGIEFKCMNCNYRKAINGSISLYQLNLKSQYNVYRSIEDNKLLALNPIYPRTKDYTCKNINCVTHVDKNLKEALYFREKDSYDTNYICNACFMSWGV